MSGLPYEIRGTNWQLLLTEAQGTLRGLKTGSKQSNFAKTLLDDDHSVGSIEDILRDLHVPKKEGHINTLETCHIDVKTKKIKLMHEVLLGKIFYSA